MIEPQIGELARRVQYVEKQNRRIKGALVVFVSISATLVLTGAQSEHAKSTEPNPDPADTSLCLEAEKFVLIDSTGKARAELAMTGAKPSLVLYGAEGKPRVQISGDDHGSMYLYGPAGEPRVQIVGNGHGRMELRPGNGLRMYDNAGKLNILLQQGNGLRLHDKDGQLRVILMAGNGLRLHDGSGTGRVWLDPGNGLRLFDEGGKLRAMLLPSARLQLFDADEQGSVTVAPGSGVRVVDPGGRP